MVKAESIAQSLNGRVVRVVETQEGGIENFRPSPTPYEYASTNSNAATATDYRRSYVTPVESGSLNVRSQVVLVVEIEI